MKINSLTKEEFVSALGWIFEHSPWVAERAWAGRPFQSREELHAHLTQIVAKASYEEQLALLRAHPDLGTKAQVSPISAREQAGVGLDNLTESEYKHLLQLNAEYKSRFGFPFLYAVKGSDKFQILAALERRLQSSPETEFQTALEQVYRIALFRLENTNL